MHKLDRYLFLSMLRGGLLAFLGVFLIMFFVQLGTQFLTANGRFGFLETTFYSVLSAPVKFFPVFLTVFSLGGFGALAAMSTQGELLALSALGFAPLRIFAWFGLLVFLIGCMLAFLTKPIAALDQISETYRKLARSGEGLATLGLALEAYARSRVPQVKSLWSYDNEGLIRLTQYDPKTQHAQSLTKVAFSAGAPSALVRYYDIYLKPGEKPQSSLLEVQGSKEEMDLNSSRVTKTAGPFSLSASEVRDESLMSSLFLEFYGLTGAEIDAYAALALRPFSQMLMFLCLFALCFGPPRSLHLLGLSALALLVTIEFVALELIVDHLKALLPLFHSLMELGVSGLAVVQSWLWFRLRGVNLGLWPSGQSAS